MRSSSESGLSFVGVGNFSNECEERGISMPEGDEGETCGISFADPVKDAEFGCSGDAKVGGEVPLGDAGGTAVAAAMKVG